jgi:Tfp pilus assembly protein PilO
MKTKNIAVGALVAVLLTALWWTMLLKPTRAKAAKVRADTAAEREKLAPLQAQLDKARRDAAHAETFKAQLAALETAVPDSPALAAFIRDANAIADASGVAWQSVTHGPPTTGFGVQSSITIGIQIEGTYGQVVEYLGRLATLQRLVVVDSVQLSTAANTGAGAGSPASTGGSTGPFSGATKLSAVISARMFETPPATPGTGASGGSASGGSTASAPPGAAAPTPSASQTG